MLTPMHLMYKYWFFDSIIFAKHTVLYQKVTEWLKTTQNFSFTPFRMFNKKSFQESSPTPLAARLSSTTPGRTSSSTSPTPARRPSPRQDGESSHRHDFDSVLSLGQSQNPSLMCHIIMINVNAKSPRQVWKVSQFVIQLMVRT